MRDLRFSLRSLTRTPVFTATAVVILALSVGAATAVFSLLYALVLRPLPIANPHELARVTTVRRDSEADLTWRMYREFAANQRVFSVPDPVARSSRLHARNRTRRDPRRGRRCCRQPIPGVRRDPGSRTLDPARRRRPDRPERSAGRSPGWTFWQTHYGGDPSVLGRSIKVDGMPLTIIGVAPRGFLGFSVALEHDLVIPIGLLPSIMNSEATMVHGTSRWVSTIGRLTPGMTLASAQAQIDAMWPAILEAAAPAQYLTTQREDYFQGEGARRLRRDRHRTRLARALHHGAVCVARHHGARGPDRRGQSVRAGLRPGRRRAVTNSRCGSRWDRRDRG